MQSVTNPLVSLCCSTYSRPDVFSQSLEGLLKQRYVPLEIIVLVDGSNPETCALLARCKDTRLSWFSTPTPSGMIPAWNEVARHSKGKYLLYCADDDVLCENAIDDQVKLLESNPSVGFCHADFYFIDDDGKRLSIWQSHEGTWIKNGLKEWRRYLLQPKACMQTCVVRRDLWDQVGGWDEDAGYPGDNSLYLKLLRISDVGHVARVACSYRCRTRAPDSWAKNASKVKEDVALIMKHLASIPPSLRAEEWTLRSRVFRHYARNGLQVLGDPRGSPEQKAQFVQWLKENILVPGSGTWFYRWLIRLHLEAYLMRWVHFDWRLRTFVRSTLAISRRLLGRVAGPHP